MTHRPKFELSISKYNREALPTCVMPGWLFNVDVLSIARIAQQLMRSEDND
jgi:hypothetical protein